MGEYFGGGAEPENLGRGATGRPGRQLQDGNRPSRFPNAACTQRPRIGVGHNVKRAKQRHSKPVNFNSGFDRCRTPIDPATNDVDRLPIGPWIEQQQ